MFTTWIVKIYKDCRIKNNVYYLDSKDIQAKTAGSRIMFTTWIVKIYKQILQDQV